MLSPEAGDKFWSHPGERSCCSKLPCLPALLSSAQSFSLTLSFPVLLAEQNVLSLSFATFALIIFKMLGTLEMLQRASASDALSVYMVFFIHQQHSGTGTFMNF